MAAGERQSLDVKDFQKTWERNDYSWRGLGAHKLSGDPHGSATLQDYWRRDPDTGIARSDDELEKSGELIPDPDGNLWHIAHVPFRWPNDTAAKDSFDQETNARLNLAIEKRLISASSDGAWKLDEDTPVAWLIGVILAELEISKPKENNYIGIFARDAYIAWLMLDNVKFNFVNIKDSVIEYANFTGALCITDFYIEKSLITHVAYTDRMQCLREASFEGSNISLLRSAGAKFNFTNFKNVQFSNEADFENVTFSGDAIFRNAIFFGQAWFEAARFSAAAIFTKSEFHSLCYFKSAHFDCGGATPTKLSFYEGLFVGSPIFRDVTWPESPLSWRGAFERAEFEKRLDLAPTESSDTANRKSFQRFSMFDGADLKQGVRLGKVKEAVAISVFRKEIQEAISICSIERYNELLLEWKEARKSAAAEKRPFNERKPLRADCRDGSLQELERGCQVLKRSMANQSDRSSEQLFYRFELMTRRAQSSTQLGEKVFSYLYDWVSLYGGSPTRPIFWLLVLTLFFCAVFLSWIMAFELVGSDHRSVPLDVAVPQVIEFCLSNTLRPLAALSGDAGNGTIIERLLKVSPGVSVCVKAVAAIESLLSVTLAFLSALAVRRKFEMN